MEIFALPPVEEPADLTPWFDTPAPTLLGERDVETLAFEAWQRANCAPSLSGQDAACEEELLRGHVSCL